MQDLLVHLNYFYSKSYDNEKKLLTSTEVFNIKNTLPPKVTGTRWLPHLNRVIESLLEHTDLMKPFSTLSHDSPKAEDLLKMLLDNNSVTFTIFLKFCFYSSFQRNPPL